MRKKFIWFFKILNKQPGRYLKEILLWNLMQEGQQIHVIRGAIFKMNFEPERKSHNFIAFYSTTV